MGLKPVCLNRVKSPLYLTASIYFIFILLNKPQRGETLVGMKSTPENVLEPRRGETLRFNHKTQTNTVRHIQSQISLKIQGTLP